MQTQLKDHFSRFIPPLPSSSNQVPDHLPLECRNSRAAAVHKSGVGPRCPHFKKALQVILRQNLLFILTFYQFQGSHLQSMKC